MLPFAVRPRETPNLTPYGKIFFESGINLVEAPGNGCIADTFLGGNLTGADTFVEDSLNQPLLLRLQLGNGGREH